jgi:hypothetical protein
MTDHSLPQRPPVTWKHYVWAAVVSFFIPFLAMLLQTGWTLWAHPHRQYQASLDANELSDPMFWLRNGTLGLLIFLVLCLVIRRPLLRWMVVVAFLAGFTYVLILADSAAYK